jgi:hypothetical protein
MQLLDGLQLHFENSCYFTTSTLRLPVPTVFTVDELDLEDGVLLPDPGAQHLRFWIRDGDVQGVRSFHVATLLEVVNVVCPPRSLHLDSLLATCATRHVEVLWYDPDEEDNYAVSPSFWRHAKRLKAEEAAQ